MYNIIYFETFHYKITETNHYKMTASGNINPWILNYKFLRPVRILRLPKD